MLRALFSMCLFFIINALFAQAPALWTMENQSTFRLPDGASQKVDIKHFALAKLEAGLLRGELAAAPTEFGARSTTIIALPMPDGQFERFEIYHSPVMRPGLARKFPGIQSFSARGYDRPELTARIGYNYKGFHAAISSPKGTIYVDRFSDQMPNHYMSYYIRHLPQEADFICGVGGDHKIKGHTFHGFKLSEEMREQGEVQQRGSRGDLVDLLVYDLALSCTGEFGQMHGGDPMQVASVFDVAVNRMNLVWEQELAIRFMLIDNNDLLIFTNPSTDPFNNPTNGAGLLDQIKSLLDFLILAPNYDIGHVFTIGCSDVGGIAGGGACGINKGRGVTCMGSTNVEFFVSQIMTHEIGHQFSAGHSWSNCPGNFGQLASDSAFEPGSGTTIMSYAGACGDQNIFPGNNSDYYHVGSLDQMYFYSRSSIGSNCPDVISTENHLPDLQWPYTDGFYIPINTPFELIATATDEDGDDLTYCWEQYNLGPTSPMGDPRGNSPLFRSFPPTDAPNRVFPRMSAILANNMLGVREETLPDYSRDLNFRCTVRDNNPEVGGVIWEEVAFKSTEQAGPFGVMHPNTSAVQWDGGSYTEVRWDVSNTDQAPVNCQFVDIRLSTDGGQTYPITLATEAPNNGAHFVNVPNNITTDRARIRVEASFNVFFDISNRNFSIRPTTTPGYALETTPFLQQICLPDDAIFELNTSSFLDFAGDVQLAVDNLPPGAVANFSNNPMSANGNSTLTIDLKEVTEEGLFDIQLRATAQGTDTTFRNISIITVNNDFSSIALMEPANGSTGVAEAPTFNWVGSVNANVYELELATSPSFDNSIVVKADNLTDPTYDLVGLLEKNTPYFWRIRPLNECGYGDYSPIFAFHTESQSCQRYASTNVPVLISSVGLPMVESTISVAPDGEISDINVLNLRGQHDLVKHLQVSLVSPEGIEAILFSDICGNTQLFNIRLDDDANSAIPCPPIGGQAHFPQEPLSIFHGESTSGTWILKAEVIDNAGEGGGITDWGLEFCSSVSLNPPFLVNNELLEVRPDASKPITTEFLLSEDSDNTPEELTYTIVAVPQHGDLRLNGSNVEPGAQFTQADIDSRALQYRHNGNDALEDNFSFTVSDGQGGWFGIPVFEIAIDENATTSTNELETAQHFILYPNPAQSNLHLRFQQPQSQELSFSLIDIQGRIIERGNFGFVHQQAELSIRHLPNGIYFIRVESAHQSQIRKFNIMHNR
ncbi:MAG: cadherin-like domain-containing protein [Bacteroidota bacterium]